MKFRNLLIAVLGFFLLLLAVNVTGLLQFFVFKGESSKPNITKGEFLLITNVIEPKNENHIVFEFLDSSNTTNKFLSRLVGKPGDTIEISKGVLYRNGNNVDTEIKLSFDYNISSKKYYELLKKGKIKRETNRRQISADSVLINMSEDIAKSENIHNQRLIMPSKYVEERIQKVYDLPWNKDYFGKLIVPKDKYFLLGDNRDNSYDSRYFGFIDKKDVIGVVVW